MSLNAQKILKLIQEITKIDESQRNDFQVQFLEQFSADKGDLVIINDLLENNQLFTGLGGDVDTLSIDLDDDEWGLIKKAELHPLDIDIPSGEDEIKMIDLGDDWGDAEESIDLGPDWED